MSELIRPNLHDPDRHRRLLVILRILPELERSGDLAEHIAAHACQGLARWLTPRALSLVSQMGGLGIEMWELAATAYAQKDATAADLLRARDDEVDDLHVSLTAELAAAVSRFRLPSRWVWSPGTSSASATTRSTSPAASSSCTAPHDPSTANEV